MNTETINGYLNNVEINEMKCNIQANLIFYLKLHQIQYSGLRYIRDYEHVCHSSVIRLNQVSCNCIANEYSQGQLLQNYFIM